MECKEIDWSNNNDRISSRRYLTTETSIVKRVVMQHIGVNDGLIRR